MAYSITSTVTDRRVNGRLHVRIAFTESDIQTDSEGTITSDLIPEFGMVKAITSTSGDSKALSPKLGREAAFSETGQDMIIDVTAPGTFIVDETGSRYALTTPGTLYYRSTPTTNGATSTVEILIVEGWGD